MVTNDETLERSRDTLVTIRFVNFKRTKVFFNDKPANKPR